MNDSQAGVRGKLGTQRARDANPPSFNTQPVYNSLWNTFVAWAVVTSLIWASTRFAIDVGYPESNHFSSLVTVSENTRTPTHHAGIARRAQRK